MAEYSDGTDSHLTGREAYDRYGAGLRALIKELGERVVYSDAVTGLLLGEVEYPSVDAFERMVRSPEMRANEHHRAAGLAGQLNIRARQR